MKPQPKNEEARPFPDDELDQELDCGDPNCDSDHQHQPQESRLPIRLGPKIGRNAPCPCDSGAKYKKCCGG